MIKRSEKRFKHLWSNRKASQLKFQCQFDENKITEFSEYNTIPKAIQSGIFIFKFLEGLIQLTFKADFRIVIAHGDCSHGSPSTCTGTSVFILILI